MVVKNMPPLDGRAHFARPFNKTHVGKVLQLYSLVGLLAGMLQMAFALRAELPPGQPRTA